MVTEEGRKNGIGIWEIEGYEKLEPRIQTVTEQHLKKTDINIILEEVLIVGSYGSGMGVKGESDLDIIVLVSSTEPNKSKKYSDIMREIAGAINYNEEFIIRDFHEINGLEAYVYPFLEREKQLYELSKHEPVEHYYNLTEDTKKSYYSEDNYF